MEYASFSNLNTDQLKNLQLCASICSACAKKCIEENHTATAILCNECADICLLAVKFVSANSHFKDNVLELCDEICKKCAAACSQMKADHCKECADICRTCSETCSRQMA